MTSTHSSNTLHLVKDYPLVDKLLIFKQRARCEREMPETRQTIERQETRRSERNARKRETRTRYNRKIDLRG